MSDEIYDDDEIYDENKPRECRSFYEWCSYWGLDEAPHFNLAKPSTIIWLPIGEASPKQYGFPFPHCEHAPAWSFTCCEKCARKLLIQAS